MFNKVSHFLAIFNILITAINLTKEMFVSFTCISLQMHVCMCIYFLNQNCNPNLVHLWTSQDKCRFFVNFKMSISHRDVVCEKYTTVLSGNFRGVLSIILLHCLLVVL